MRLEDMAITLRPRTASEAIDLGYAMTQAWWRTVFAAWCAVYLPAAVVVNLLCWQVPALSVFVLWWLKPAFDRVVLHVLAGATFGATPTLRQTLRDLPRLWWKNGLFSALTYARFDFARSFTLPVTQLEGSRGKVADSMTIFAQAQRVCPRAAMASVDATAGHGSAPTIAEGARLRPGERLLPGDDAGRRFEILDA